MRQMIEHKLTGAAAFADRHQRKIDVAGAIWLALSSASYVAAIDLPDIPFITDQNAWMFSGGWNAAWWGFIHPAIARRRKGARPAEDRLPGG